MAADSATITYDSLGRVTQVLFANGTKIIYNYDSMGNRTSDNSPLSTKGLVALPGGA